MTPCPLQRQHSHPEHGFVADIDIVLAHDRQLAVIADAENRQASGERLYYIAIPHIDRVSMCWIGVGSPVD